jgi:hypothetical protein
VRGLNAAEYEALKQAERSARAVGIGVGAYDGFCPADIGWRLIARGCLTSPEIIPGAPHPVVCLSKLGALAIRCHEAALRLVI